MHDPVPLIRTRLNFSARCVLLAGACCIAAGPQSAAAARPAAIKSPVSPEDSLRHFRIAAGAKIELVAAEPQIVDPVAIAFDEDERMYVVEMGDYPTGPQPGAPHASRIKRLEDRDHDGRYETAHLFADQLPFCTGVQPWQGGVIVTLAGEIAWFKDTDGDGKFDLRETWFRGFAQNNPQMRANHPTLALDNHIYVAGGHQADGGTIVADEPKWGKAWPLVPLAGKDFRFDPRTGECEAVSGNSQFGLTFDDWGNRFVCDNRHPCRHVVLEDRYTKRNPFLALPGVAHDVCASAEQSRIYPLSGGWTTSHLHAGQYTAACGVLIYRGTALPPATSGNVFVCDPTGNLVHRERLEDRPTGEHYFNLSTFFGKPVEQRAEFLATPDEWFRPVDLSNGPDGALYVVDMYRAVIEHPEYVPDELKTRPDTWAGNDRGRIYRIVGADFEPASRPGVRPLSQAAASELVALLGEANGWQRDTAARLLLEQGDPSVTGDLATLSASAPLPVARVRALWLLGALDGLTDELLAKALRDGETQVRRQAMILAEPRFKQVEENSPLLPPLLQIGTEKGSPPVQQVLSLGELPDSPTKFAALARAALAGSRDEWFRRAVLTAVGDAPHLVFREIVTSTQFLNYPRFPAYALMLRDLAEVIGARRDPAEISPMLAVFLTLREIDGESRKVPVQRIMLAGWNGLTQGLIRRGESPGSLLDRIEEREEGVREGLQPLFDEAVLLAEDVGSPPDLRLEAIRALPSIGFEKAGEPLMRLVRSEPNRELRLAAIDSLAVFDCPPATSTLLDQFGAELPVARRAVLRALLFNDDRTRALLSAIAEKRFAATEIDPATVQLLLRHKDAGIRGQARQLLAALVPADRQRVLEQYQPALSLKSDPQRGKAVFETSCATCHKVGDAGVDVAPTIADSRTKTPAQLLADILNPNAAIESGYIAYTITTRDGRAQTGIIDVETPASITLRQPEGKTVRILRSEIAELYSSGISLMPEGLEKTITVAQMADLIAYLKNWRYLDGAVPAPRSAK